MKNLLNKIVNKFNEKVSKQNQRYILYTILILVIVVSFILRFNLIEIEGGDHLTYKEAVLTFLAKGNPYEYTVLSYQTDKLDHGYAYLPSLLYIQSFFVYVNKLFNLDIATAIMWKIPVFLTDYAVAILIFYYFKNKDLLAGVIGVSIWLLNPYFIVIYEYTHFETFPVLFLFLSILFLRKKDHLSGLMLAIAISFKTFPLIFIPLFFVLSKKKINFALGGILWAILISLPFLRSVYDFKLYFEGSFLVHGDRGIQGRPILSTIRYFAQPLPIMFFQSEFSKMYSILAITLPSVVAFYLYFRKKITNVWILTMAIFLTYIIITPVFNRTHLLWALPFLYIGSYELFKNNKIVFYSVIAVGYFISFFYYDAWDKGLKHPRKFGGKIWVDNSTEYNPRFPLYVEFKQWIQSVK